MQYSVGVTVYRVEKGPFRDGISGTTNPVPKWLEAEIVLV